MRRRLFPILLLLLGGACAAIAVALALAWLALQGSRPRALIVIDKGSAKRPYTTVTHEERGFGSRRGSTFYGAPTESIGGTHWEFGLGSASLNGQAREVVFLPADTTLAQGAPQLHRELEKGFAGSALLAASPIEDSAGWPFAALACWYEGTSGVSSSILVNPPVRVVGGFDLNPNWTGQITGNRLRAIPYTPRWGGLLANTALYAGAFSLVFFASRAARQARRRRRGQCFGCGYPIDRRVMAACPECGLAAAPRPLL